MYLKFISMKNMSAIEELTIEPSFTGEGNPKPLIIVGENGSGKTVLLSSIMDSFYEIGSELFYNIRKQENSKGIFYKPSGVPNLKMGSKNGFVAIQYKSQSLSEMIEYLDCIGCSRRELEKEIQEKLENRNWILFPDSATSKKITKVGKNEKLQIEWNTQAHYYQPAYRYEEPFWKNPSFYHHFEKKERFSDEYYKEIEILTSLKENLSFIMDVVLDSEIYKSSTNIDEILILISGILDEITNTKDTQTPSLTNLYEIFIKKINNILIEIKNIKEKLSTNKDRILWGGINNILRTIKGDNTLRFGIGARNSNVRLGIMKGNEPYLDNVNKLSLGESLLLNMFVNILRHTDLSEKPLEELEGIVVIDEIDVHLHSNLQSDVLPSLIKLFPKIQFIITTHSPLFVLGMQKVFGDNGFDLIEMPQGEKISAERFKEFQKAYDVLKETKAFENDIENKILAMQKPKVFVEGKTDVQYIKKALELLDIKDLIKKIDIEQIGYEDENGQYYSNDKYLFYTENLLKSKSDSFNPKVLILHDPETNGVNVGWVIDNKVKIAQMPLNQNHKIKKGIENLFPDDLLRKCYENQDKSKKILDKICRNDELEKFQINDKQKVCDWICKNGTKEDFEDFQKIIQIFDDFLADK